MSLINFVGEWALEVALTSYFFRVYFVQIFHVDIIEASPLNSTHRYNHHHRHHVVPLARISLTLSRHSSLSFIASVRSSGLHPVSSQSWSSWFCSAIWWGQWENITYELVPGSPAMSRMSGSSNFDSFRNGR